MIIEIEEYILKEQSHVIKKILFMENYLNLCLILYEIIIVN